MATAIAIDGINGIALLDLGAAGGESSTNTSGYTMSPCFGAARANHSTTPHHTAPHRTTPHHK